MKWSVSVAVLLGVVVVACGGAQAGVSTHPSKSPTPVVKYRSQLVGQSAAGPVDLIQNVLDFAPGAASIVHLHTSPNLATVLQGQITIKAPSGDKQAGAGQALVEPLNEPLQATNLATGETMVAIAFSVPHSGKPTTPVAGQPAPAITNKTLYSSTVDLPSVTGGYGLIQQVLDFAPGARTAKHRHGGPGVITVLAGQVTLDKDGAVQTYGAGQSFTEMPGEVLQASNPGTAAASVVASYLLPDGAQLTTNV